MTDNSQGVITTVLPFIISSASYLIIPYPRPLVILINSLPALAVKLLLPSLLLHLPRRLPLQLPSPIRHLTRGALIPSFLAALFALTAFITASTPPNVPPPVRVAMTTLASAGAAAAEVFFLGRVRRYGGNGGPGLVGWGIGTGLGDVVCAVLPLALTVRLGLVLRDAVRSVYYLAALMLVAYFVVLPPSHPLDSVIFTVEKKSRLDDGDLKPLMPGPSLLGTLGRRLQTSWKLACPLVRCCMIPLFLASTLQSATYPGISRAQVQTPLFTNYNSFSTTYGLVTRLGALASRSFLPLFRVQKHKLLLATMSFLAALPLLAASSQLPPYTLVVFAPAFGVGLTGGLIYSNVFARSLEQLDHVAGADAEFCFGTVGAGETAGVLMGSLLGSLLEAQSCASGRGPSRKWCYTTW